MRTQTVQVGLRKDIDVKTVGFVDVTMMADAVCRAYQVHSSSTGKQVGFVVKLDEKPTWYATERIGLDDWDCEVWVPMLTGSTWTTMREAVEDLVLHTDGPTPQEAIDNCLRTCMSCIGEICPAFGKVCTDAIEARDAQ